METISFARGVPAPECLPVEELADCARGALERDGATVLSYGSAAGYGPLRNWIAERHSVDPARVLVTNGSLQGMVFLAERFAGERVVVEAPTYDRPLKILSARGVETVAVDMDDEGLDLDALAEALDKGRDANLTRRDEHAIHGDEQQVLRAFVQPPRPTQYRQHPPLNARLRVVTQGERCGIFRDQTRDLAAGHAERRWNLTTVPCPQRASVHVPRRHER